MTYCHLFCLSGAMESDYPSGEELISTELVADDTASISSTGSDMNTFGNVTMVTASLVTPRSGTPSSERGKYLFHRHNMMPFHAILSKA